MDWLGTWTWDELKEEVDRGHREFFAKRGIEPRYFDTGDFIFGKGRKFNEDTSRSLPSGSDRPTQQSSQGKNRSPF